MGYKGNSVQGEIPESGAIFMSNIKTHKECLRRELFGLPPSMSRFVLHVKEGMPLFLFEFERRLLYGVFRATCDGEINIEPKAFRSSGKQFPAQVRFTTEEKCSPLAESEFKDAIKDNYFSGKKFHFGLNETQVRKLMKLFRSKRMTKNYPERNIRRYDDKPTEEKARSGDLRKDIRHRLRYDSCDFRGDEVQEVDDNMYINKHIIEARQKDKREGILTHYLAESDEFGDYSRHGILGKHLDLRETDIEDGYMPVFSKPHGSHPDDIGVGSSDILMDGENKDIIDYNRLQGDYSSHDILGKHLVKEENINDGYMPLFSKPHVTHLDEIGMGSSDIRISGENKDIIDYNRLKDEYDVRERVRGSLKEQTLTNHGFSHFNQNDYSNCGPTRIDVPDIRLSPSCFDDGSSFIPIVNNRPFYPSPEKIPMTYYSHDEGLYQYLDDPGPQSSIFPKFISRNSSSSDAGLRVREVDPTDNDKRFCEKHESKHRFGTTRKRESVFSRLSSTLRHEELAFETDENHELNSSVDKVMKMLEKVVSSPKKRRGKSTSVTKKDNADRSPNSKIKDYEFPDVNVEVDADVADEEAEGESAYQETRLVDFKRRRKSSKRTDDASKDNSECLVGATSDVGPAANDHLMGMSHKRRKLLRPAFVEKNFVPDSVSAHENTLSANDDADVALESSKEVDVFIKSLVPTCLENTPDDSSSRKAGSESKRKVDVIIKHSAHENLPTANDSADVPLGSSEKVDAFSKSMVPTGSSSKKARSENLKKVDVSIKHSANENTLSAKDSADVTFETSEKVDAFRKSMVPTGEKAPDDSSTKKAGNESSKKVDVSMIHGAHENIPFENDSADVAFESSEKVNAFSKSMVPTGEETPDDSSTKKAGNESSKKVDVSIKHGAHENIPSENDSTDVAFESSEKVNAYGKSMVPTGVKTPDDSTTKAGSESLKKVDVSIKHSAHENTFSANESANVALESSDKVDAFTKSMVPTCHENTPDDNNSTKAGSDSSKKVDLSTKPIDLNMMPTSDESSSSIEDNNSTKVVLESQRVSNEGDGNAESRLVSDVFVEGPESKDDQNMCGWIEW